MSLDFPRPKLSRMVVYSNVNNIRWEYDIIRLCVISWMGMTSNFGITNEQFPAKSTNIYWDGTDSWNLPIRQSHCKKCYLQDLGRPSTTFLTHLFGKIDSFLPFCSLRSPRKRGSRKTARKNQFCQNKCVRKVVGELNKSQYFQFADNPFCKTTDDVLI